MSEAQSRPTGSRGRGAFRGGRGGFRGSRGGSKPHKTEDQENVPPSSLVDQGEVGELKKQYGSKVSTLRELFPDWSDEDLVYALKETDGDLESAIDRMSSGR
jgi:CUE domain